MAGRVSTRRLVVGVALTALLNGCAADATQIPSPATPTISPSALVVTHVTEVTGTGTCLARDLGTATTDTNGVLHFRSGAFTCTAATDDPRVSGTETASNWIMDLWRTTDRGAGVQSGPLRLESSGGAWVGKGSGVYSSDRGDIIATWYEGTGGYAGLGYFELWTGTSPWAIRGLIFASDPIGPLPTLSDGVATPKPIATASLAESPTPAPTAIAYGPVSVVTGTYKYATIHLGNIDAGPGGVARYGNGVVAGVETTNDPRVTFTFSWSPWTIDLWGGTMATGSGVQWGPGRDENAGGAWDCSGSGIVDGRGDTLAVWCRGTGDYAGLSSFELITSLDPFGMAKPDGADGTIHGQVFPGDPPTT
jgi:hypothetical protein